MKTTVRDSAGNFREALRICVVGHDPLVKLRKIVLVIARDRNDAQRLEDREVVNEDVVLLEPTTVIQRALEYDCDLLRRNTRSPGTYFLEMGLIRFRGQFDYAACLSVNCLSNSAGLTIPMAE